MISNAVPKRVLIADDSSTVRNLVKNFLEKRTELTICGEAGDGVEAVEKTRALKPDLVILDLSMPRMNGAEAASHIKKLLPGVRIILFTMYNEYVGKSLTSAIGVDAVLCKPDGMTALVEAIEEVFRSSTPTLTEAAPNALTEPRVETISLLRLVGDKSKVQRGNRGS